MVKVNRSKQLTKIKMHGTNTTRTDTPLQTKRSAGPIDLEFVKWLLDKLGRSVPNTN